MAQAKTKKVIRTKEKKAVFSKREGRKYIRVIADYGPLGDLAFAEVTDRMHAVMRDCGLGDYRIDLTSVPAFDTYATGFALAQLALNSPLGEDHIFYVNTAPRKDNISARIDNEGEGLVYVRLKNGVQIVAVNSGYSLSFVKPFAETIRVLKVDRAGSQFRSRDIFPRAVGAVLSGDEKIIGNDAARAVPDKVPENRVVYTDGYGNLKTSVDPAELKQHKGQLVYLKVGDADNVAVNVGTGIFDVPDGDFCFATGSSGWDLPKGGRRQFAEVVKRGGSAANAVGGPHGGRVLVWKPVRL